MDYTNFVSSIEPIRHNIENLKKKSEHKLIESISKYTSEENVKKFIKSNVPLKDIGICTGISLLVDKDLQELHPELCILTTDTLTKFLRDIERDFKYNKY